MIDSPRERAAVLSMMAVFMLANALTFLVPLYIQMVQGRSSLETAVAMIPYQLAVFAAAIFVLTLYDRLTPRQIARYSFVLISVALVLLAVVTNNEWNNLLVIPGLVLFGLGQGALATLLFNVLVVYAPKGFAGDVGSLRGTIKNLAAGVGTALAGALAVGILARQRRAQPGRQPDHSARADRAGRLRPGELRQQRASEGRAGRDIRHAGADRRKPCASTPTRGCAR